MKSIKALKFWSIMLGTLTSFMVLQAQESQQNIRLHFAAMVGEQMATCAETYADVSASQANIRFNDFRFYVSNIQLLTAEGEAVALQLEQDGMWQYENVALLDFENGEAGCSEIGNQALNGVIIGSAPEADYVGVRFDLGVPFELNHLDVTAASSPLNIAALWWNWQGGYKFARIDLVTDAPEHQAWNIHLGSTGCVSPAGAIAPKEPCARPNITRIYFDAFDFDQQVIVLDLAALLTDVPLYENTLMPPGCMSGVDDPDCPTLFANLGLSLNEGICTEENCASQKLFRLSDITSVTLVERTEMSAQMHISEGMQHHHDHGSQTASITLDEATAIQIALDRYPDTNVVESKSGMAYGVQVWDIELSNGVSIEIDQSNGEIVEISGAGEDWENPLYSND